MEILPLDMALGQYKQWYSEIKLNNQQGELYSKYLQGKSILQFNNGNHYSGELKFGFLNGKGIFKWSNGLVYEGQFRDNLMNGTGRLTWPDGSYYEGEVRDNQKHGKGTYYSKQDNSTYVGEWMNGQRTGNGRIQFSNGTVYQGQFKNGNKQGFGRMSYPSGNSFEGHWLNNVKQGQGTMIWLNTNQKYIGNWSNNKQNGRGVHIWLDNGSAQNRIFKNRYDGEWIDCRREGFGTFYYHNGSKYDGRWKNNQRDGFGILTEDTGFMKIGFFKEDRLVKQKYDLNMSSIPESLNASQIDTSILNQSHFLNQSSINPTASHSPNQSILHQSLLNPTQKPKLKPLKTTSKRPQPHLTVSPSILPSTLNLSTFSQLTQNPYFKFLDLPHFTATSSFQNYLLRQHSSLRQWYKLFTFTHGQYYSGMVFTDFVKIMKQLRVIEGNCNVAMVGRIFGKGKRSGIDLGAEGKRLVEFVERHEELYGERELGGVEVRYHAEELYHYNINQKGQEQGIRVENSPFSLPNLNLLPPHILHQPSTPIFFRHFINLLLILSHLKYPTLPLQLSTPKLFQIFSNFTKSKQLSLSLPNNKLNQSSSKLSFQNSFRSSIPLKASVEWTRQYNMRLFERLTEGQRSMIGVVDRSVTVKRLFRLLIKDVLKEVIERYVFFEKVQKYFDLKHYYFKKEYKLKAEYILSHLWKSEIFKPLLNYQLVQGEFCDLLEITLLKKLSSSARDAEDLKGKYVNIIGKMVMGLKQNTIAKRVVKRLRVRVRVSDKGRIRAEKITEAKKERVRMEEESRKREEEEKEMFERECMAINDCNIMSSAYLEESEDQFD